MYGKDGQLNVAATLEGPRISKAAFSDVDSVYRSRGSGVDAKQRLWYILDNVLVLPEYIIEFEYKLGPGSKLSSASTSSLKPSLVQPPASLTPAVAQKMIEGLEPDLRMLARPMLPWLALRHEAAKAMTTGPPGGGGNPWADEEAEVNVLLASPPVPAPRYNTEAFYLFDLCSSSPTCSYTTPGQSSLPCPRSSSAAISDHRGQWQG